MNCNTVDHFFNIIFRPELFQTKLFRVGQGLELRLLGFRVGYSAFSYITLIEILETHGGHTILNITCYFACLVMAAQAMTRRVTWVVDMCLT